MIVLAFFIAYVVKPAYTILALALIWRLRRCREVDLVALRWALLAFWIGDGLCTINFFMFADGSNSLEFIHDLGMAASLSLGIYAVCEGFDRRVLGLSDPLARCAALPLCRACVKHEPVPCGLRRTWQAVIGACLVVAPLPMWTPLGAATYTISGFGGTYTWNDSTLLQTLDTRWCPMLAAVLLAGSLAALGSRHVKAVSWAKVLFAAGFGPLAFGFLRFTLISLFRDNLLLYTFWEDFTELLAVLAVGFLLAVFRRGLFPEPESVVQAA